MGQKLYGTRWVKTLIICKSEILGMADIFTDQ